MSQIQKYIDLRERLEDLQKQIEEQKNLALQEALTFSNEQPGTYKEFVFGYEIILKRSSQRTPISPEMSKLIEERLDLMKEAEAIQSVDFRILSEAMNLANLEKDSLQQKINYLEAQIKSRIYDPYLGDIDARIESQEALDRNSKPLTIAVKKVEQLHEIWMKD